MKSSVLGAFGSNTVTGGFHRSEPIRGGMSEGYFHNTIFAPSSEKIPLGLPINHAKNSSARNVDQCIRAASFAVEKQDRISLAKLPTPSEP